MENSTTESRCCEINTTEMEDCADVCSECYKSCVRTIKYCLERGGEHAAFKHMNLLTDCARICITSAEFIIRGSDNHGQTCRVCAEICHLCAEEFNKMTGFKEMEKCAEVCEKCAKSCEQMRTN